MTYRAGRTMKTNTRFIQSVVKTVQSNEVVMPWTRGKPRQAFIEKRRGKMQNDCKSA
jgi:hypothetical protein